MSSERFEELLRKSAGLDAPALGRGVLERAIKRRMTELRSASSVEYLQRVEQTPAEMQLLIDEVVVLETSFFRDTGAYTALQEWVRTEWMRTPQQRALTILSIPSSTGEEPYSIAMALLDLALPQLRFRVDAVDISTRALRHARAGIYGTGSFRGQQLDYRDRYFEHTMGGYRVIDAVRENVDFKHGNILDAARTDRHYDIVFCRNLLIYFDAVHQQLAMDRLLGLVSTGGLLFLGPAETFLASGESLRAIGKAMSFGFERINEATPPKLGTAAPRSLTRAPSRTTVPTRPVAPTRTAAPTRTPASSRTRASAQTPTPSASHKSSEIVSLDAAEALADSGNLAAAAEMCRGHIALHGSTVRALFMLGVVSDSLGDARQAVSSFRKVLYLEPGHTQALMHLSMLAGSEGGTDRARHLDRRARSADAREETTS